ncbi:MAG: hypothetical protein ACRDHS_09770 [Actinomycetota bacterium]
MLNRSTRREWGLSLLAWALLAPTGKASAQEDRPTGWIVFHAGAAGRHRLVWKDVLTGAERELVPAMLGQGNPSAARTGDRVAFQRAGDIWAVDLKSGRTANLTRTERYEGCPWVSGDGSLIAFDGIRDGRSDIFLIMGDGSGVRPLTRGPGNHACPALSPDGKRVAFVSDRHGQMEIYLLDVETGVEWRLTDHPEADMDPAFSPDGSRIAFTSDRRGKFEIYEMNLDGSGLRRLTEARDFDIQPVYSSDGRWIAFERDGTIVAVHRDTGTRWPLTRGPEYQGGPTWGPSASPSR